MYKVIDFDKRFAKHLHAHHSEGEPLDDDAAVQLYIDWLSAPADFLNGESPTGFFAKLKPQERVDCMLEYIRADVNPPDPLLDALVTPAAEPTLFGVLSRSYGRFDNPEQLKSARLIAAQSLNELNSPMPLEYYIQLVRTREDDDPLADVAAEGLMNLQNFDQLLEALPGATAIGKECLLDILCAEPGEELLEYILCEMKANPERVAFYASLIARCGFESAQDALAGQANRPDIGYLDFVAIRNAIEDLGGTLELEREFSGDPDYERLILETKKPR